MNKIDEMISKLCPNGITMVPLWKYTAWDKKFKAVNQSMQKKVIKYKHLLANELENIIDNTGDIRVLYTSEEIAYTTEEKAGKYISEGEIIAIPWGGTPTVKYYKGRFVTGDNRIATSIDQKKLNNKFLYYILLNKLDEISTFYRGAGLKHPSMLSVLSLEIPLPPLAIQQEIVSVLDHFSSLIDKMKEQLVKRKKQLEYYREKLLTFDDTEENGVKWMKLSDECLYSKDRIDASDLPENSYIGVENLLKGKLGRTESTVVPMGSVIKYEKNDILIGNIRPNLRKIWKADSIGGTNGDVLCIRIKKGATKKLSSDYLFHILASENFFEYDARYSKGGKMPRGDKTAIMKYLIPVPPLDLQHHIASTLDLFDTYITKLEKLITLRQKQYEYYRDKLLTFE